MVLKPVISARIKVSRLAATATPRITGYGHLDSKEGMLRKSYEQRREQQPNNSLSASSSSNSTANPTSLIDRVVQRTGKPLDIENDECMCEDGLARLSGDKEEKEQAQDAGDAEDEDTGDDPEEENNDNAGSEEVTRG